MISTAPRLARCGGQELRVEQPEAAEPQPRDEMHQRRPWRRRGRGETCFRRRRRRAEAYAIEAADQLAVLVAPRSNGRGRASCKLAIEPQDFGVDPGLVALGAGAHHAVESRGRRRPRTGPSARSWRGSCETTRPSSGNTPRASGSTQNRCCAIAVLGHREQADRIGAEQQVGGDLALFAGRSHEVRVNRVFAGVKLCRSIGVNSSCAPPTRRWTVSCARARKSGWRR